MNLRLTVNSIQPADPHSIGKRRTVERLWVAAGETAAAAYFFKYGLP